MGGPSERAESDMRAFLANGDGARREAGVC